MKEGETCVRWKCVGERGRVCSVWERERRDV